MYHIMFQVYNIMIHNFYRLCFIYCYYKILTVFSVLYNIPFYLIYFILFLAVPRGMWDLSSLTRDRTFAP